MFDRLSSVTPTYLLIKRPMMLPNAPNERFTTVIENAIIVASTYVGIIFYNNTRHGSIIIEDATAVRNPNSTLKQTYLKFPI